MVFGRHACNRWKHDKITGACRTEPTGGGERMGDEKRDLSNCRGRVLKKKIKKHKSNELDPLLASTRFLFSGAGTIPQTLPAIRQLKQGEAFPFTLYLHGDAYDDPLRR